jgi:hypothetical protein
MLRLFHNRSFPRSWTCFGLIGIFSGIVITLHAAGPPPPASPPKLPSGTVAAKEALRRAYNYDPNVRQKAEADAARVLANGALQMETVVVNDDSKRNPSFNSFMERQRQLKAAAKPSVADGASFKGSRAEVGIRPYINSIPFGTPTARWSLIKILF